MSPVPDPLLLPSLLAGTPEGWVGTLGRGAEDDGISRATPVLGETESLNDLGGKRPPRVNPTINF